MEKAKSNIGKAIESALNKIEVVSSNDKANRVDDNNLPSCLSPMIGQENAKEVFSDSLNSVKLGREATSFLILGEAGLGKSHAMRVYAQGLEDMGWLVKMYRSPEQFRLRGDEFSTLCSMIRGELSTQWALFIDEAHLLCYKNTVQSDMIKGFVMKALDNNEGRNIPFGDGAVFFNKCNSAIVLATNHPGKLSPDGALKSRTNVLELEHYSPEELMQILLKLLHNAELRANEISLKIMVATCRGTARPIERLVETLRKHCSARGKDTVNRQDIIDCLRKIQFFPKGLSINEMRILDCLKNNAMRKGIILSRTPNVDSKMLDYSICYMLSCGLLKEHTHGFITSEKGISFLQDVRKDGFKW